MGKLLCEKKLRDVWCQNESVRAEIGPILLYIYQGWVKLHKITSITITITLKYQLQSQLQLHYFSFFYGHTRDHFFFYSEFRYHCFAPMDCGCRTKRQQSTQTAFVTQNNQAQTSHHDHRKLIEGGVSSALLLV